MAWADRAEVLPRESYFEGPAIKKKVTKKGKGTDCTVMLPSTVRPCPDFEGARSDYATSLPLYVRILKRRSVLNRYVPGIFRSRPVWSSVYIFVQIRSSVRAFGGFRSLVQSQVGPD